MSERDAGLLRTIGTRGLAANIVNSVIGGGIFAVPAALAACIGPYAPLAFLVCGVAIGAVAICFAEGGSRMPTSGGPYGYVEAVLGSLAGFIVGTLLWLGNVLANGGVVAALADIAASLLPPAFKAPVHAGVIVGVIGGVTLVNLGGVRRGARLVDWVTGVKLIPLAIFLVAGVGAIHRANFVQTVAPSTQGLGRAMILALFVLTGMEISLSVSGEVKQPARTIPRALATRGDARTAGFQALRLRLAGRAHPDVRRRDRSPQAARRLARRLLGRAGELNRESRIILDALKRHGVKAELWVLLDLGADRVDGRRSRSGASRPPRPSSARWPRRPARSAARWPCTTTAAGSASRRTRSRSSSGSKSRASRTSAWSTTCTTATTTSTASPSCSRRSSLTSWRSTSTAWTRAATGSGGRSCRWARARSTWSCCGSSATAAIAGRSASSATRMDDAEERLRDNLDGLDWLVAAARRASRPARDPSRARPCPPPPASRKTGVERRVRRRDTASTRRWSPS